MGKDVLLGRADEQCLAQEDGRIDQSGRYQSGSSSRCCVCNYLKQCMHISAAIWRYNPMPNHQYHHTKAVNTAIMTKESSIPP